MFQVQKHPQRLKYKSIFDGVSHLRVLLDQGLKMGFGVLKTDENDSPVVAEYSYPPLVYLAGDPDTSEALALVRSISPMQIIITPDDEWLQLLKQELDPNLIPQKRWKLSHDSLDMAHLQSIIEALDPQYTIETLNKEILTNCDRNFIRIMYTFHGTIDAFLEKYTGFCVLHEGRAVSMTYPGHPFENEFEIHIETIDSPKYRRKGLATAVGAKIIQDAFNKELIPHWDAANEASVSLALKLGYTDPSEYFVHFLKQ
jgi:RimJ/RimL family protein N-acetyltransferase